MRPTIEAQLLILFVATVNLEANGAETHEAKLGQSVELQLANGDRISGDLLLRADGKIRVRSPILGEFSINETDVALIEVPQENLARAVNSAPVTPKAKPTPDQTLTDTKTNPTEIRSDKPAARTWKGKLELGIAQQSGRVESQNHQVRAEAERNNAGNNLRATARLLYTEQNNQTSADRSEAALRWRHQLTKRAFAQTQTSYYRDNVTRIQLNGEQNIGLGYRFVDLPRHVLNFGGGLTAQYREWEAGQNGFAPYIEIFQDYTFKINTRISLAQDASVQYSPYDRAYSYGNNQLPQLSPDQENYKVRFNTTLQGKITDHISANLRFEYEEDNAIKLTDARTLQRITSSLGYAF